MTRRGGRSARWRDRVEHWLRGGARRPPWLSVPTAPPISNMKRKIKKKIVRSLSFLLSLLLKEIKRKIGKFNLRPVCFM